MAVGKGETRDVEEAVIYFKGNLKKKEGKSSWKEYWVVLTLGRLSFYGAEDKDKFVGKISLSPGTRCCFVKRRTYSFRFRVVTQRGAFLFKSESYLERWQWIYLIGLSVEGKQPGNIPEYVPKECRYSNNNDVEDAAPLTTFGFDTDEAEANPLRRGSLRRSMRRLANRMSLRKKGRTDDSEYKALKNSTSTVTLEGYEVATDAAKSDYPHEEKLVYL